MMRVLRFSIFTICLSAFVGLLAGYFGAVHPAFDSFSAFRLHLAALLFGAGLIVLMCRRYTVGAVSMGAAVLALWTTLAPAWTADMGGDTQAARYRLLQVNVRFNNPNPKELLRVIAQTRPDVITAQEVTPRWRSEFATIKAAYPYQIFCAAHRKIGDTAILSRRPFVDAPTNYCGKGEAISIQNIQIGDEVIAFASVHLYWPWPHQQPKQVLNMEPIFESMAENERNILIAGDLNAPRWSKAALDIARFSKTDVLHYRGGSWLAFEFPQDWINWFGLALDNAFSSGVIVTSIETQSNVGSDHLPLLIEFVVPARQSDQTAEPTVEVI